MKHSAFNVGTVAVTAVISAERTKFIVGTDEEVKNLHGDPFTNEDEAVIEDVHELWQFVLTTTVKSCIPGQLHYNYKK